MDCTKANIHIMPSKPFNNMLVFTIRMSLVPGLKPSSDSIHMARAGGPRVLAVLYGAGFPELVISATNFVQSVMDSTLVRIVLVSSTNE